MIKKEKQTISFLANIKEIRVRNLISGDKEVKIDLRIVGADVIEANKLADVPIGKQVKVIYEK